MIDKKLNNIDDVMINIFIIYDIWPFCHSYHIPKYIMRTNAALLIKVFEEITKMVYSAKNILLAIQIIFLISLSTVCLK